MVRLMRSVCQAHIGVAEIVVDRRSMQSPPTLDVHGSQLRTGFGTIRRLVQSAPD
jgi:hypothetical protein